MAKRKVVREGRTDEPEAVRIARYRLRGGVLSAVHPVIGTVTNDHIEGPKAEIFIKAFKAYDKKTNGEWFARNIEELN